MPGEVDVVLVVDDEEGIRNTLRRGLERAIPGVVVKTAASGIEALSILDEVEVDLIISDHRMPGMAGIDFLTEAHRLKPDVPTVLITAFPDIDLLMRGANDAHLQKFLSKPFTVEAATKSARELLDVRRATLARATALQRARSIAEERLKVPQPTRAEAATDPGSSQHSS